MHPISPGRSHGTRMCPLHTHTSIQWRYLFSHSQTWATPYTWTHTHASTRLDLQESNCVQQAAEGAPVLWHSSFLLCIVSGGYSNKRRTGEHCVCGRFTPSASTAVYLWAQTLNYSGVYVCAAEGVSGESWMKRRRHSWTELTEHIPLLSPALFILSCHAPRKPFMRKSNRWFGPDGGAASCGGGLSRSLLEAVKGSVSSQLQLEFSVQLKRATLITISILGTG